jgi:hypothetical protein
MKKIIQLQFPKKIENGNDVDNGDPEPELDPDDPASISSQIIILNELFLGCETTDGHKTLKRCVAKKRLGYKSQDVANEIFDAKWFVTLDEILELLVASKLQCHYCRKGCAIKYSKPLLGSQWTLDRICNDQGHNRQNVVISCLKCNLRRGLRSSRNYRLGQQMKFIKTHNSTYDEEQATATNCPNN